MREMESSLHESQESAKRRFQTLSSTIKLRNFDPVQEDTATKRPCKVYCGGMHESQQRLSAYYIIIRIDVGRLSCLSLYTAMRRPDSGITTKFSHVFLCAFLMYGTRKSVPNLFRFIVLALCALESSQFYEHNKK